MTEFIRSDFEGEKTTDWKHFGQLVRHAAPQWKQFFLGLCLVCAASFLGVWAAQQLGKFIDQGILLSQFVIAKHYAWKIILAEILAVVFAYYGRSQLIRASYLSLQRLREYMFHHIERLPLSYFDREPVGRVVTRLTHDVEGIDSFFSGTLTRVVLAVASLIFVIQALLWMNVQLASLALIALIPALSLAWTVRKPIRERNRDMSRESAACNAQLNENLNGLSVIRLFGVESWSLRSYDRTIARHLRSGIRMNRLNAWSRPLISFFAQWPLLIIVILGTQHVLDGLIGVGIWVAMIRLTEKVSRPMLALFEEIHVIQQAMTSAERVSRFLNHPIESDSTDSATAWHIQKPNLVLGDIRFEHVFMSYTENENWILRDLSFQIRPGEKVGIVGKTGSGKSSLVSLISRLYPFQKGKIFIHNQPIESFTRNDLRQSVGYLPQDPILFHGSVRENLCLDRAIADQELILACQQTGLWAVLQRKGFRLESEILDRGNNLSSGERQLMALTRILLRDPQILILDEATANIDPDLELIIHRAVDLVMNGRTSLIIAHRTNTLSSCDRIIELSHGTVLAGSPFH